MYNGERGEEEDDQKPPALPQHAQTITVSSTWARFGAEQVLGHRVGSFPIRVSRSMVFIFLANYFRSNWADVPDGRQPRLPVRATKTSKGARVLHHKQQPFSYLCFHFCRGSVLVAFVHRDQGSLAF
jgi:hypothetical protein